MQIFKTKHFAKWAKKQKVTDEDLKKSINEMQKGLIDANLGGQVYKKRVARNGQGKSGSYRTIVLFKLKDKAFFVYGFEKNKKDNISPEELKGYKMLADDLMILNKDLLALAIESGVFMEVE